MIKRLLSYVKEYKKESILTPLSMIIEVAMEMVVPLLMASLVNDGINAKNEAGEIVGDINHIIIVGIFFFRQTQKQQEKSHVRADMTFL